MATLNRKFLKALGIEDAAADAIIEAHTDVTSALVSERDEAKKAANQIETLTKENADLKAQIEKASKDGAAEIQKQFDAYKKQIESERLNASKVDAVKTALKAAGVQRDEFIDLLMGKVDLSKVDLKDGSVSDNSIIESLKTSYAGCFGEVGSKGADLHNPPSGGNQQMTKDAFFKLSLTDQMSFANEHPEEWAAFNK